MATKKPATKKPATTRDSKHKPVPRKPSEVFRSELEAVRRRKNWSQERLAEAMTGLGLTMNRSLIAKIESNRRNVSIDEALAFAVALGVSPAALLLPRETEPVHLAPNFDEGSTAATLWFRGLFPFLETLADPSAMRFFYEECPDEWAVALQRFPGLRDIISAAALGMAHAGGPEPLLSQNLPALRQVLEHIIEDATHTLALVERKTKETADGSR